ncbi:MAG: CRTAC1 family protein, partial [Bryobacteraceae bacterium]
MRPFVILLAAWALLPGEQESPIRFANIAPAAGIQAQLQCGGPEKRWIPEANGSGCAALDYDNDGLLDLLIVNGTSMERLREVVAGRVPSAAKSGVYLYRNLGDGRFEDVTERAGLFNPYWATGANAADFNNDGFTDLLITTIGVDLLFKNNGNGTFSEIGKAAGISRQVRWHTGSAFGDYDNDGFLDLFIAGYVDVHSVRLSGEAPVCDYRGLKAFCGPLGLKGEKDVLYHNNGNGTFTDVTEPAGVNDAEGRYGFTAVFDDFNGDGKIDLFVANDSGPNYFYRNLGNGKFRESALSAGVAFNADGKTQANMGVAVGDYDNDGKLDFLTTTFSEDYFPLFRQQAAGIFEDVSNRVGLELPTIPLLGWACGFADFHNDGYRDLWVANGHVYPNADRLGGTSYLQPVMLFQNRRGRFSPVRDLAEGLPKNSYRGGCTGDFNNDGKIDLAVVPISGLPLLLENRTTGNHSWIGFSLHGTTSNRDAIGSQVRVESCGQVQFETVRNGGSYLSHNDSRVHFGLGVCSKVDKV